MAQFAVSSMNDALARAEAHAPYLRLLMQRQPTLVGALAAGALPLPDSAAMIAQAGSVQSGLRQAKAALALALAIGDLAGVLALETVVGHLSDFADSAFDWAITAAFARHVPDEAPRGFAIISLGKHGGRELNYSSDIDPIFLFDPKTLPHRPREEPEEAAVRIGRHVLEIMQARDGDGYVFRIDLRLRPSPEVTPIALPVDAAISHYESSALQWERAAFIRARNCAGDLALGQYFLDSIRPFVWRRGLDFGTVGDIRGMTRRIRDHYARGQAFGPGFDLKRGRGGIREVEFFTQIHQLIHGGRDTGLRSGTTPLALAALAEAGQIGRDTADTLTSAYRLYRTLEHRLQMVDDQQTHSLPETQSALDSVALLHGLENGADLLTRLAPHVSAVGGLYDALEGVQPDGLPQDQDQLSAILSQSGHAEAGFFAERITHWRSGTIRALRTPAAQAALESVLPRLANGLIAAAEPRQAIVQLDTLIERLPSAINLFRLLEARPNMLDLLITIICFAPTLANELAQRTQLFDGLIDASALDEPSPVADLVAQFADPSPGAVLEERLDRVRLEVGERRFALGVQIVEAASDPLTVAAGYARVAEAAIHTVADAVCESYAQQHGRVPGSALIILALGRMGGTELTHASDLDLIYLFTGAFDAESDGPRPLGAVHYYNRLSQRITAGLSVPTSVGPLYEVDTRLRPSGADGPLAVSLEGFARYQRENAWTWEHMALCRARVVYGPAEEAEAIMRNILQKPRDPAALIADARKMRGDMAQHKPAKSALDVKLGVGGLVDLEFCVHVQQLRTGIGHAPELGKAIKALVGAGHLPETFIEAHCLMTRLLVTLRLVAPGLEPDDPATQALIARACLMDDWAGLLDQLSLLRQEVRRFWEEIGAHHDQ